MNGCECFFGNFDVSKSLIHMKRLITLTTFLITVLNLAAQDVDNIIFQKAGTKVFISYDLKTPIFTKWSVSVYFSKDGGLTWGSPLQKLTGEFGDGIRAGYKKKITWDFEAEKEHLDGKITFKVEATRYKGPETYRPYSPSFYRYKKAKEVWFTSAVVFTAAGFYLKKQSDNFYNKYRTAESNAGDLHRKVDLYDKLYPAAFGLGGLSAANFIYKIFQKNKAKKMPLIVQPFPLQRGGGIGMAYNF